VTELETLAAALAHRGGGAVLATLVGVDGSAYRGPGARMLAFPDGTTVGAVSGGCLEKDIVAHAESVRANGKPTLVQWDLTHDDDAPWGLGMGCNARLEALLEPCPAHPDWLAQLLEAQAARRTVVLETRTAGAPLAERSLRPAAPGERTSREGGLLREVIPPPLRVVAFGDGADTGPLTVLATAVGWQAVAVRKDEATPALDARSAAVVMTHHYPRDLALLAALLPSAAGYVGVLGPRARTERLLAELGSPAGADPRVRGPVGLDIGAETPHEIALAVLAEVRAVFAGRAGGPLQHRLGPIHDR
jgi:xanthine dehydrogenase accessory factor